MSVKDAFRFSLQLLSETFLILRINEPYKIMKPEISRYIFKKILSYVKFHENPSSGSRVVVYGQTDMTKLTVVFLNFANAPTNDLRATHSVNISSLLS
jgi:hypothetical protein